MRWGEGLRLQDRDDLMGSLVGVSFAGKKQPFAVHAQRLTQQRYSRRMGRQLSKRIGATGYDAPPPVAGSQQDFSGSAFDTSRQAQEHLQLARIG